MTLNALLVTITASASVLGAGVLLHELTSAYHTGGQALRAVQAHNDSQTLLAARAAYALSGGPLNASEAELVAKGFLSPDWLERELVDLPPLELPDELAAEGTDQ